MTIVCVYIVVKVKPKKYICKMIYRVGASVNDLTFVKGGYATRGGATQPPNIYNTFYMDSS